VTGRLTLVRGKVEREAAHSETINRIPPVILVLSKNGGIRPVQRKEGHDCLRSGEKEERTKGSLSDIARRDKTPLKRDVYSMERKKERGMDLAESGSSVLIHEKTRKHFYSRLVAPAKITPFKGGKGKQKRHG